MLPCQVVALANVEMAKHGLIARGWRFKLNSNRARLGVCKFRRIPMFFGSSTWHRDGVQVAPVFHDGTIEISKHLLPMGEAKVKNTLMHEIAHALVGPKHGHNHVWRSKAIELGCNGERCTVFDSPHKYDVVCAVHGVVAKRNRLPKRGYRQSCPKCCRGFNANYILTYRATGN